MRALMLRPGAQQDVDGRDHAALDIALTGATAATAATAATGAAHARGRHQRGDLEHIGRIDVGAVRQQRLDRRIIVAQRRDHQRAGAAAHHVILEAAAAVAIGPHARELMIGIDAHARSAGLTRSIAVALLFGCGAVAPG